MLHKLHSLVQKDNAAAETQEEQSQRNEILKKLASVNQHPPVHQLEVLSTGWGGISHPVAECALTPVYLFDADRFPGFFLAACCFLNSDLTCPATYYPTFLVLPTTKNQAPSLCHLPTY